MKIHSFTFNPFQENTYVISSGEQCFIIDPGCSNRHEEAELQAYINDQGWKPLAVINTHCHIDHIMGNTFCCEQWDIPLWIHSLDLPNLNMGPTVADMYGLPYHQSPQPSRFLDDLGEIVLGYERLDLLFTPGHAPGHICLVSDPDDWVVAGDTLFQLSIGRTDLPGGNHDQLLQSIQTQLFTLPEQYIVYCGHGPATEIGFEKRHNPFFPHNS